MGFRYTEHGVEREFTNAQLQAAQERLKVTLSCGGETILVTRPTGKNHNGLFIKAPTAIEDKHLHFISEPEALVLLGTDETALEKSPARHPWRKRISLDHLARQFGTLASLEHHLKQVESAFSKLKVTTNVSGWVLTDTPFSPSLALSGPPKLKKTEAALDLVVPAPKLVPAADFVRQQSGTVGLSVARVDGLLASNALLYAVPAMKGWVAVPLPLVADLVALASTAARPLLQFALDTNEVTEALSEMQSEVIGLARWFPELMRRSGMPVPSAL